MYDAAKRLVAGREPRYSSPILGLPDRYFLPNSNVILFYEKIYYIRISLSREE